MYRVTMHSAFLFQLPQSFQQLVQIMAEQNHYRNQKYFRNRLSASSQIIRTTAGRIFYQSFRFLKRENCLFVAE